MVHSVFPAGRIITNGLGGSACDGGLTISNHFSLYGCIQVIITTVPDGGGGSIPLAPGEIANLYQPVSQQYVNPNNTTPPYYVPTNQDPFAKPQNLVTFKISIMGNEVEREFLVDDTRKDRIIKILDILVTSKKRLDVKISSLKVKLNNIIINIRNLRKK